MRSPPSDHPYDGSVLMSTVGNMFCVTGASLLMLKTHRASARIGCPPPFGWCLGFKLICHFHALENIYLWAAGAPLRGKELDGGTARMNLCTHRIEEKLFHFHAPFVHIDLRTSRSSNISFFTRTWCQQDKGPKSSSLEMRAG